MSTELAQRPKWDIDRTLEELVGADVRVAAKAFSPTIWTGETTPHCLPVRELFLPDNSQPEGLQVFFEGWLQRFQRQVGVVWVHLDALALPEVAADGPICFRGSLAVILRGPAVMELAFPFRVERLPTDPDNCWRDLRVPRAQLELPF